MKQIIQNQIILSIIFIIVAVSFSARAMAASEINLKANGIDIKDGSLHAQPNNDTYFRGVRVDSGSLSKTFTIENTGTTNLILMGAPSITGTHASDFTVTIQPLSLVSAGGSTNFTVEFDPSGDGYRFATISIVNDDINENPYDFVIKGRGIGNNAKNWAMDTDLSASNASFWGEDSSDYAGNSVSSAGDVNGDGYDDLLIGAYWDEDGGSTAGQTYLILGKSSGWAMDTDLSNADASFWGEDGSNWSGYSVSSAGDVNGDGYDDILIGAPSDDDGGSLAGQTYLILGKSSGWAMDTDLSASDASFWGEGADSASGYSVSSAGDVNGDGYDDILIGAWFNGEGGTAAGQTYLILGKPSGWAMDTDLSTADASFWGEDAGDESGLSVSSAGDINGDGYDDLIIGAYKNDAGGSNAGQTYLILGKSSGWAMDTDLSASDASFWGEDASDFSGYSVSSAGDVNGDGYDDLIIGAYGDEDGGSVSGQTYLILGKSSGWAMDTDLSTADASFLGEDAFDKSGFSVSSAGDVNGDGYDDFLIGAYANDDGGSNAGQTYLILGKSSGWAMDTDLSTAAASFWGEDASNNAGTSVSSAGDVNGDGYDDLLIGALDDDGGSNAGQTYLILGGIWGEINLTGNGININNGSLHAQLNNDTYFKGVFVGSGSMSKTFTIKNTGVTDLNLNGTPKVSITGTHASDFTVTTQPSSPVSAGGSTTFTVEFDPSDDGYRLATIGIANDVRGETPYDFVIKGRGIGNTPQTWVMDTDLSASDASFWGEDANDLSGRSVASAGDVNGDGYDDLLIGAYGKYGDTGQTYLILGKPSGWAMDEDLSLADASFLGEGGNDRSGYSVSSAGDVNGDGYDDLLIGAERAYGSGSGSGQTYLILGKSSGWAMDTDLSTSDASFWGEDNVDFSGRSVSSAGDVNGDGFDDLLIGAYGDEDAGIDAGQTYLILGKSSGWAMDTDLSTADASFWGEDTGDESGFSVSSAGDVNGDGYDDLLIGAWRDDDGGGSAGQTYLIFGKPSGWTMDTDLSTANASFWGEDLDDWSGDFVSSAGDVNGDGYDDLLIGARGDEHGGKTYLILGKPSGWTMDTDLSTADASFWGESGSDGSGRSVSSAGDVNGDGYDDLLIGATGDDDGGSGAGQTYLILGKPSGWAMNTDLSTADASFWGENSGDFSGQSVSSAGDVNGDGYDDLFIGAYGNDAGGSFAGQTYLIFGGGRNDINLTGNGININNGSLHAQPNNNTYFRGVSVDAVTISKTFTIENKGPADLTLSGAPKVAITGTHSSDFTVTTQPTSPVSGGGSTTFTVEFDPSGDGYRFGTISIENDDSDENPYEFVIKGRGIGNTHKALAMDMDLSASDASFWGEDAGDGSGLSVSSAGDVNGDGYDDLLIGASKDEDGGSNAGQTYLILGKSSGWIMDTDLSNADASFWGEDAGDQSGLSVSSAGDVNGDGYDDLLIGAYLDEDGGSNAGQTYLILGKPSGWAMDTDLSASDASFWGEDGGDQSGFSVSSAGDVNGDGYDDILIGAWADEDGGSTAGQTYLILGKPSGWAMDTNLATSDASFWGEDASDWSGYSVSLAGDVNGDGYDDLLIGAWVDENGGNLAGQTYLILGKPSGWAMDTDLSASDASFWGENANDFSGLSVSSAGDVNGDGYDDLLMGAYGNDHGGSLAGQTYLILGKPNGWAMDTDLSNADASFLGEDSEDRSGLSVSSAGDVNGDGYDDFLIGAYNDEDGGGRAGQTYLILGKSSGWAMDTDLSTADASLWGEDSTDSSGYSVSSAGDVNGDGYDDLLIGAYEDEDGGTDAGQTYLILGGGSGEINLTGNGINIKDGSLHAQPNNDTYFRGVRVDSGTLSKTFTIENTGTTDLMLSGVPKVAMMGTHASDYTVTTQPISPVLEGGSTTFTVEFDPSDDGYRFVTISIANDDNDENPFDFVIKGRGIGNTPRTWAMDMDLSASDASFWGEDAEDRSGLSISSAGDVNGDGYDDLLIGASKDEDGGNNAGQTYLILGKSSGWAMDTDLSTADASFWGEDAGDQSGVSVSSAGDVNGDGYDDLLIGAYLDQDGGSNAGQTYLILGKPSGWVMDTNLSASDASFWGEDGGDQSGVSVSSAGDVNGDGYDDILIGAWTDEDGGSSAGQTYLILGKSSGWAMDTNLATSDASFWGEDASDLSGYSVSSAGDVNGDGYDDFLIGAWFDEDGGNLAGQTYLILGKPSGWAMDTDLSTADASFWGEDADDYSGLSVSSAGDVNADGYDDILIGAYGNDDGGSLAGQTYLILGKPSGWAMDTDLSTSDASFWGEDSEDRSGLSVSSAGDANGDGYDDFIIGAFNDEDGGGRAGQTYLILGKSSGWAMDTDLSTAYASLWGEDGTDSSGYSVSSAGDVNGDGHDDLLIGAYEDEDGGTDAGQTYLILGGPPDITAPTVFSSVRADPNPTNATSVDFTVTFSESVTGVDTTDFAVTTSNSALGSVFGVSGIGATYTVTVDTISGSGALRLDVSDDDTIVDANGNPLGGLGSGNGDFTAGEAYTIEKATLIVDQSGFVNDFGNVHAGQSSGEDTYTIAGVFLESNITINVPAGFEVSTMSGAGFGSTVTLIPSSGTVNTTTIYVRFSPSSEGFTGSLNITHVSGTTNENIGVQGTGIVEFVNIPDSDYKSCLVAIYDTNIVDGEIDVVEAATVADVDCQNLGIKDITGTEAFVNLTNLNVAENLISFLPDLSGLSSLGTLDCSSNQLVSIETVVETLILPANLSLLYLNNNRLTNIPQEIGNLVLLLGLDLSQNQILYLPDVFHLLSNLESLDLQGNNLSYLPMSIGLIPLLTHLDVGSNRLTSIPTFSVTSPLISLTADQNLLETLPNLEDLANLQHVNMSSNRLTDLILFVIHPSLGDTASHVLTVDRNLLTLANCTHIDDLEARFAASGALFVYNPQGHYSILWPAFALWPTDNVSILVDLINEGYESDLICP